MPQAMMPVGALKALTRMTPDRASYTLRLTLVCVITALVTELYQVPSIATTVYVAFFVYRPNRGATVAASIGMTIFATLALLTALFITKGVLDHPFWRVCAMAAFSFGILLLASASKLKPIAPILAVIVGYVLDLLGGLQIGDVAVRGLLYTWLVVAIPAGVSIAFALLAGPRPRRLLELALARRLRRSALALRTGESAATAIEDFLREGDAELVGLLNAAARERELRDGARVAMVRAVDSTMAVMSYASLLAAQPRGEATDTARRRIADVLDEMADIMRQDGYPVGVLVPSKGFGPLPEEASCLVDLLRSELTGFAEGAATSSKKHHAGFMLPDAFTNPVHIRYALKTTAAAMACYLVFQQLDWPGIHTCLITCYVVSLGSAGETIEKLALRIAGCLVGAALGFAALIFAIPQIDGITGLAAVVALGTIPAAWTASGGPRIGYAGLQIALAFYLIVLQGPSPSFDLAIGRDRIIGVLFGNVMVYLVFTRIWPVSVCSRVDPGIAELLRSLAAFATSGGELARRQIGSIRTAFAAVHRDLEVARYEPRSIRPPDRWLDGREATLFDLERLQAPLLVHAARMDGRVAAAEERLLELARDLTDEARPTRGIGDEAAPFGADLKELRTIVVSLCSRPEVANAAL